MSQQQIIAKCNEVFAKALALYGVDLANKVRPAFNLKGRVAGYAGWKINRLTRETSQHTLRFNHDMVTRNDPEVLREMVEDTVPHEIAHLVCALRPELGKNHDYGWARVCRALGGTGARTHDMDVVYGKGITYEYTTDRGNKVRLNERRHQAVQAGRPLVYRKGLGTVRLGCAYSIVGHQGRTLQQPIVKQLPMNHPAVIEEAVRTPPPPPVLRPAVVPGPVLAAAVAARPQPGESKAAVSRRIMLSGTRAGHSYEAIISAMMLANGYDRQLARATYKANAPKLGLPVQ